MAWYSNWFSKFGAYADMDDSMKKVGFYSTHKGRRYVTAAGLRSDHAAALAVELKHGKGDSPEKAAALDAVCDAVIPEEESTPQSSQEIAATA